MQLDKKDRKLLVELSKNSRQPISDLSKKINLSKESTNYRFRRLIEKGILKKCYANVNKNRLEFVGLKFLISLQYITEEIKQEIIKYALEKSNTNWVSVFESQKYDISFVVWAKETKDIRAFKEEFLDKYSTYIETLDVALFEKTLHYPFSYLLEEKKERRESFTEAKEKVKIDTVDRELLKILSEDARVSTLEIKRRLKVPLAQVKRRIKYLEEQKVIEDYTVSLDLAKLGYEQFKVRIFMNEHKKRKKVLEHLKSEPNMMFRDITVGSTDIEVGFHVKDINQLNKIISKITEKFSEVIESYEHTRYVMVHHEACQLK